MLMSAQLYVLILHVHVFYAEALSPQYESLAQRNPMSLLTAYQLSTLSQVFCQVF